MDSWLTWSGRNARWISASVGIAVLLLITSVGTVIVAHQAGKFMLGKHLDAFIAFDEIGAQADQLLTRLHLEDKLDCESSTLKKLRGILFEYRYLKEIGLIDAQNNLYCSTSQGLLTPPLRLNTDGLRTENGDLTKFQVPILVTQERVKATIVQRGNVNVVVEPNALDNLNDQIDVAWYRSERSRGVAYLAEQVTSAKLTQFMYQYDSVREGSQVSWSFDGLFVTSTNNHNTFVLQSFKPWDDVLLEQATLLLVIGGVGTLSGLLVALQLGTALRQNLTLEARIDRLLDTKHLLCMYQPIVALDRGTVVGCEVLMRINDGHQVIFPDEIIPAVMTRGLMQKLDREVSKKAMHELLEKIPNDKPFRLAFNFFPESVNAKQLDAHFKKCLGMRDYPAVTLDLEITEYSMSDSLVDEVKHLRKLHYHISIDDFGTGYSNLKLLSEVKPDVVKIDKSFVFDMEDASLRSSLIPEMVTLARGIGAKVVAEGIENEQQARLLRELSVDYGQGYYFAKPMPLEEFLIHLASHS